jgi:hypothetical protein
VYEDEDNDLYWFWGAPALTHRRYVLRLAVRSALRRPSFR